MLYEVITHPVGEQDDAGVEHEDVDGRALGEQLPGEVARRGEGRQVQSAQRQQGVRSALPDALDGPLALRNNFV